MPVVKKRKNAEEEDPTYEQQEVSPSEEEDSNEEETLEEEEEVDDDSGSTSVDEEELPSTSKTLAEQVIEVKKKKTSVKRKHNRGEEKKQKSPVAPSGNPILKGAPQTRPTTTGTSDKRVKKVARRSKPVEKSDDGQKKSQNLSVEYNDKNVDYNLYNEAPEHIKNLKIKISSNVIMLCRMIEATGNTSQGLTYDYAALSFVRQSKNGKAYEFNLPLNLAPSIVKGITLLIKQNPKFFDKQFQTIQAEEIE